MKKPLLFAFVFLAFSFIVPKHANAPNAPISDKERSNAIKLLYDTENDVLSKVGSLSQAQLQYKPAPDVWSVEECLKHIAISEQNLWQMISGQLQQPVNPDKRSEIKMTDDQLVGAVENRTHKVKTTDPLKPENTPYKSAEEAIASFKENRAKLIAYVRSTQEPLRDHVITMPFGMIDGYMAVLFIGAHSNRHSQQIAEVMANPAFPK
jgi:DinB family protein